MLRVSSSPSISSEMNTGGNNEAGIPIHRSCYIEGRPRPPPLRKTPMGPGGNPCLPCGGTGDPLTPVYGRYGAYFDPALVKKAQVVPHHRRHKKVHEILIKSKNKTKKQELLNRLFPLAPKPYLGPHNIMWNPHVRRGPTLVHFSELEKVCPIPAKGSWAKLWGKRKSGATSTLNKNPIFRSSKGCPTYPDVVVDHKLDLTDFSQFLEEQEDPLTKIKSTEAETQTEDYSDRKGRFRHNFQTGLQVETQADFFHISTEMRPTAPNPITQTIRSMSSVLKTQLISQSLVENMEYSELAQIRGQADALELWIAQEQMRLAKVDRDLCKKMERMKREAELEAVWERRFEDLRKRVGGGMMANCMSKSIVGGAFCDLETIGVIGADKEAEGIISWVHSAVTDIVIKNRKIVYDLLDDIINEANNSRAQRHSSSGGGQGLNDLNTDASDEEGGLSFSMGNFGEIVGEDGGNLDEKVEKDTTGYDTTTSIEEGEEEGMASEKTKVEKAVPIQPTIVQTTIVQPTNAKKEKETPPIVSLVGPKF